MKKNYLSPEALIARFDENDILTVSTGDNYISFDLEEQVYE